MTLSLAWNKKLKRSCYIEKLTDTNERHRMDNRVSQELLASFDGGCAIDYVK
jgi:hypothetical protein